MGLSKTNQRLIVRVNSEIDSKEFQLTVQLHGIYYFTPRCAKVSRRAIGWIALVSHRCERKGRETVSKWGQRYASLLLSNYTNNRYLAREMTAHLE